MISIGIDPGKSGGIAYIMDGEPKAFPYDDKRLVSLMDYLHDEKIKACVEKVGAMPGQGVVSMFSFGKSAGFIEGVLQAFGIPYQLVPPQTWKKEFSINKDKSKAIEVCRKLFPGVNLYATERCKKEHDGMAEALLMAEYARRKL